MGLIDNIIAYAILAYILFAIGKYLYDQFKVKNYVKSVRNVVIGIVVVLLLFHAGDRGWLGHNDEPCYSYDSFLLKGVMP